MLYMPPLQVKYPYRFLDLFYYAHDIPFKTPGAVYFRDSDETMKLLLTRTKSLAYHDEARSFLSSKASVDSQWESEREGHL